MTAVIRQGRFVLMIRLIMVLVVLVGFLIVSYFLVAQVSLGKKIPHARDLEVDPGCPGSVPVSVKACGCDDHRKG